MPDTSCLPADGQPLADHAVRLSILRPAGTGAPPTSQLVRIETTDVEGRFAFVGLQPGDYAVEVRPADGAVTSATVTLKAGASQIVNLIVLESNAGMAALNGTVLILAGVGAVFSAVLLVTMLRR